MTLLKAAHAEISTQERNSAEMTCYDEDKDRVITCVINIPTRALKENSLTIMIEKGNLLALN